MLKVTQVLRDRHMSKAELSRRSRIDYGTVVAITNGKMKPWPGWQQRIAKALNWQGDSAELFEEVK